MLLFWLGVAIVLGPRLALVQTMGLAVSAISAAPETSPQQHCSNDSQRENSHYQEFSRSDSHGIEATGELDISGGELTTLDWKCESSQGHLP
jgi:hypothetical protein